MKNKTKQNVVLSQMLTLLYQPSLHDIINTLLTAPLPGTHPCQEATLASY
jgi:hypothetical protein